jgi:pimeloyl-ACP methyl ester carboxylesterase
MMTHGSGALAFELSAVPGTPYRIALRRWEGRRPCLVYLHGIGLSGSGDWPRLRQSASLAGRASLAVDLLGFGQSPRPPGFSYELEDQAELLAALLPRDGAAVALVGHSMGGTIAILLAERLVREGRPPDAVLLAEPNLRAEDANLSARVAAIPLGAFIKQWPQWVDATELPYYRDGVSQAAPLAFHRSATSLGRHGQTALAHFVALPVSRKGYVLGGKSDAITQETARQVAAARIPVVTVPGSGHAFCGEDPEGLAQALAQLLER